MKELNRLAMRLKEQHIHKNKLTTLINVVNRKLWVYATLFRDKPLFRHMG